jgi:hypothetical protein
MKKMSKVLAVATALAAAGLAVAQDGTTDGGGIFDNIASLGLVGLLIVGVLVFFLFNFFIG